MQGIDCLPREFGDGKVLGQLGQDDDRDIGDEGRNSTGKSDWDIEVVDDEEDTVTLYLQTADVCG